MRFPKFTEDWIKYHLKEIAEKVNNKNNDNKIETVFSNSAVQGIVLQSDYFDKSIANKENLGGYYIVEPFDFVYNPRLSATAEVGAMSVNNTNLTGLVSPLYTVFRVKESNINIPFLEYLFKSKVWHNYMRIFRSVFLPELSFVERGYCLVSISSVITFLRVRRTFKSSLGI